MLIVSRTPIVKTPSSTSTSRDWLAGAVAVLALLQAGGQRPRMQMQRLHFPAAAAAAAAEPAELAAEAPPPAARGPQEAAPKAAAAGTE